MAKNNKHNKLRSAEKGSPHNIHLIELSMLKQIVSSLTDPLYIKDQKHEFTFANDAYCQLTGYNFEDLIGRTEHELFPKNIAENLIHSENNVFATKKSSTEEEAIVDSNSNIKIVINHRQFIQLDDGKKIVVCTVKDFTEIHIDSKSESITNSIGSGINKSEHDVFRYVLNQMPDAVLIIDWKGQLRYYNSAAAKLVELDPKERFEGLNVLKFVLPSFRTKVMTDILSVKKDQGGYLSEYKIRTRSDKIIWVEGLGSKIVFENQSANLVVLREITARKKADQQAAVNERQYQLLFNTSPIGVMQFNPELEITDCNEKFAEILLTNRNKLIGLDMTNLVDQSVVPALYESLKGNSGYYEGVYHTTLSESEIWVSLRTAPIINENEEIESCVAFLEDISERKLSEESLRKRDDILKSISLSAESFLRGKDWIKDIDEVLQNIGYAADVSRVYLFRNYYTIDNDLKTKQTNEWAKDGVSAQIENPILLSLSYVEDGFERWLNGLSRGEIIYGLVKDFPEPERIVLEPQEIKSILIVPIFVGDHFWGFIGFDECSKERYWSEPQIEALKTAGKILGSAIQRKAFENRIMRAKEEAEKSEKLKTEFLAQMSHEIRTPLNVLLNFNEEIKEEVEELVSPEIKENFEIVRSAGNRIIKTVELILNMSSLQSGNYEVNISKFDLSQDVILPLIKEYELTAEEKNLELKFNDSADQKVVESDRYSVQQIFQQLLDNAVKFTSKGSVTVSVSSTKENIKLEVEDTGVGISEKYQKNLFKPFSQEEHGYTRSFDGSGLGLALVYKLCELNNFKLNYTTQKGKGTLFTITFPI